jgi:hypothetical protein
MSANVPRVPSTSLAEILDQLVEKATEEKSVPFASLAKAAGLDPARDFVRASLREIDLRGEDLRGFDFSRADLTGADFRGANMDGVSIALAITTGAVGLPPQATRRARIPVLHPDANQLLSYIRGINQAILLGAMPPGPTDQSRQQRTVAFKSPVLGPLRDLAGLWVGTGFSVIWRPGSPPEPDHFLELHLTHETLQFEEIPGERPNHGFPADIQIFGLRYLHQIEDLNTNAELHFEPGIWAAVPQTDNPAEALTVVRMASMPDGTGVLARGTADPVLGPPIIPNTDTSPFVLGNPQQKIQFPVSNLSTPSTFRSSPKDTFGINQAMVDNPNSVLKFELSGQTIKNTIVLQILSSDGGVANTSFPQGSPAAGSKAHTALVSATFWIETLEDHAGGPDVHQLQYTQTVLLNFSGLSWPHITVATLRKSITSTA